MYKIFIELHRIAWIRFCGKPFLPNPLSSRVSSSRWETHNSFSIFVQIPNPIFPIFHSHLASLWLKSFDLGLYLVHTDSEHRGSGEGHLAPTAAQQQNTWYFLGSVQGPPDSYPGSLTNCSALVNSAALTDSISIQIKLQLTCRSVERIGNKVCRVVTTSLSDYKNKNKK